MHYTYIYADPRTEKVFYVGMGTGNRFRVHMRPSVLKDGSPKSQTILEILGSGSEPIIKKVLENVTLEQAIEEEKRLIALYGKENLTNRTTGGQGHPGSKSWLGRKHSEEAKEKIRASKLGKPGPKRSEEAIAKFRKTMAEKGHPMNGKEHTAEAKEKIRSKLKGVKLTEEQKLQRKEAMRLVWEKRRNGELPPRKERK